MPKPLELLKDGFAALGRLFSSQWSRAGTASQGLLGRIPPARRQGALIGLCAGLALILALLLTILFREWERRGEIARNTAPRGAPAIPPEEFFFPGEPDFLPGFLLEREKREVWTGEDARPFWTDPLDYGAGPWIEGVRSAVDELLERVP
jgi:hypothetical protein